jgi:preprotein translocase subunit SecD
LEDFPDWFPKNQVNLGLDLQGGSHLLLELDYTTYRKEQLANLVDEIRSRLRSQKLGYRGLSSNAQLVRLSARNTSDVEAIRSEIRAIDSDYIIDVDAIGGFSVQFSENQWNQMKQRVQEQTLEIISRRVNETGTKEPIIQMQGRERILLQVPGLDDPEKLKDLLGQTAKMTFHLLDESVSASQLQAGRAGFGTRILRGDEDGEPYAVRMKIELSGDLLDNATATFDQGRPAVAFSFNTIGARKFGNITRKNVGKPFAIVLDNKVLTAPVIQSPITGGNGIITGNFTVEEANNLALLLRAGALPVPLEVVEERTVGPSLGADSIAAGKYAAMIAITAVIVFMFVSYGLFGIFANLALVMNTIIILATLSLFQATLTLPGIAGIVLTVGMAVDANVLIFERIREEIRVGKTPFAAIDTGFKVAFNTILDSNLTTIIAAFILFHFGTGTIKGFAVTLIIGILSSMFSAIMLTRFMVVTWLKRTRPQVIPI